MYDTENDTAVNPATLFIYGDAYENYGDYYQAPTWTLNDDGTLSVSLITADYTYSEVYITQDEYGWVLVIAPEGDYDGYSPVTLTTAPQCVGQC